jgi:hypothetical protein
VLAQQTLADDQQGVAGIERELRAVRGGQGRAAPPGGAAVHDVVVDEERVVQQLDRDRHGQRGGRRSAEGPARGQAQAGP